MPVINQNLNSTPSTNYSSNMAHNPHSGPSPIPIRAVNQARGEESPQTRRPTVLTEKQASRAITRRGLREILLRAGHQQRASSPPTDNNPVRQQNVGPQPHVTIAPSERPTTSTNQADYQRQGARPKTTRQHHPRVRRDTARNSTASTSTNSTSSTLTSTSASENSTESTKISTSTSTHSSAPTEEVTQTAASTATPCPKPRAHTYICDLDRDHPIYENTGEYDPEEGPYAHQYVLEAYFPYGQQHAVNAIERCDAVRNQTESRDCENAAFYFCEVWLDAVDPENESDCIKIKEYVNNEHPSKMDFVADGDDYSDHNHYTKLEEKLRDKYGHKDCNPIPSSVFIFITSFFGALLGSSAAILLWQSGKAFFQRTLPERRYNRLEEGSTESLPSSSENISLMDNEK